VKLYVGDLVRPKSRPFHDSVGFVIAIGFMGAIGVRLLSGRVVTYNKGVLQVLSSRHKGRF